MSLDAMDWVWENSRSKGVARLVMLAIADKARAGNKAYAGMTFLQHRANAGRSTVIGAVRELVASGELEIVEGESGRNGATVYRLPKAAGHVRRAADEDPESVQDLHQADEEPEPEIGADSAPVEPVESDCGDAIGADSAPIPLAEDQTIGADPAPIQADSDGASNAPAHPESVQILDAIGADSAPHHQTPEEVLRTSSSARKRASPKRGAKAKQGEHDTTRGTRLPEDFKITPEMEKWGRARAPYVNGPLETEKFINHFLAASGQRAIKRDWLRTWQNWILNAIKDYPPPGQRRASPQTTTSFGASRPEVAWCGTCNKLTRQIEDDRDVLVPCPVCSPHRRSQ